MKHISILVPVGAILASLEGSRQLFTQVNGFLAERGGAPLFDVQLVGLTMDTKVSGGLFTVNAQTTIEQLDNTDLIIIPAIDGEMDLKLRENAAFLPWIKKQYAGGAEIASLCLGAFLLGATGLLNGKHCATHWMAEQDFRKRYPEACLVTEKIITEDHGIYCSGGAFSYLNLILYLIEKYAGRELAVLSAKVFAIEIDRKSQLPFTIFHGQKTHEDSEVKRAQDFIEQNFQDKISVEQLTGLVCLSRRNFERRFKKATDNTVLEYIHRVKIEVAKKQLEQDGKSVSDVMYDLGYVDHKAFRSIFKKITGLSPVAYKNKFKNYPALV